MKMMTTVLALALVAVGAYTGEYVVSIVGGFTACLLSYRTYSHTRY